MENNKVSITFADFTIFRRLWFSLVSVIKLLLWLSFYLEYLSFRFFKKGLYISIFIPQLFWLAIFIEVQCVIGLNAYHQKSQKIISSLKYNILMSILSFNIYCSKIDEQHFFIRTVTPKVKNKDKHDFNKV